MRLPKSASFERSRETPSATHFPAVANPLDAQSVAGEAGFDAGEGAAATTGFAAFRALRAARAAGWEALKASKLLQSCDPICDGF